MINHDQFLEPIATDDQWDLYIDPNTDEGKELYGIAKFRDTSDDQLMNASKNRLRFGL
jgi:hypothetical protein